MKRVLVLAGIVLFTGCSVLVHPFGNPKAERRANTASLDSMFGAPAAKIIQKACMDCHSENTQWPWYSYVPPMSWLIEKDVNAGRSRMNLSRWSECGVDEQQQRLAKISILLKRHAMPLPRYLLLHPQARLTEDEITYLAQWARRESRRISEPAEPRASRQH